MTRSRPPAPYDPAQLAAIYDDPNAAGRGFVFRHSEEMAYQCCRRHVRRGQTWIDAGCGSGHLSARLAGLGVQTVAVDWDFALVEWSRKRWLHGAARGDESALEETQAGGSILLDAARQRNAGALQFVQGSAACLPARDRCTHGLVAVSLAGCLPDFDAFVSESHRVLLPGGRLVLTITNRASLLLRANSALQRIERQFTGRRFDPRRYVSYDSANVVHSLKSAGFLPLSVEFYNYAVNVGPWLFPPRLLAVHIQRGRRPDEARSYLARNFVIVAEKR